MLRNDWKGKRNFRIQLFLKYFGEAVDEHPCGVPLHVDDDWYIADPRFMF